LTEDEFYAVLNTAMNRMIKKMFSIGYVAASVLGAASITYGTDMYNNYDYPGESLFHGDMVLLHEKVQVQNNGEIVSSTDMNAFEAQNGVIFRMPIAFRKLNGEELKDKFHHEIFVNYENGVGVVSAVFIPVKSREHRVLEKGTATIERLIRNGTLKSYSFSVPDSQRQSFQVYTTYNFIPAQLIDKSIVISPIRFLPGLQARNGAVIVRSDSTFQ
jgi:hypothetical protein